MLQRIGLLLFAMGVMALGCAEDPAKSKGGNHTGNESGAGTTGEVGGTAGTSSFGNSDTNVAGSSSGSIDAGSRCEVGKFCPPEELDPGDDCGSLTVETDVKVVKKPGNVLVIFDRSGSMDEDWEGKPRYQSAGDALIAALAPLEDMLTVGGVFFPSLNKEDPAAMMCDCGNFTNWIPGGCCLMLSGSSCVVTTIDEPDQISFRTATDFITELPNQWRLQGAGGTPLQGGTDRGAEALAGTTFADPVTVVILTDGAPNCGTDQQKVLDQVTAWKAAGIMTHVVGLPGSEPAKDLLTQLAVAGGGTAFIDPADPADLQMRLNSVFTSTIRAGFDSCSMTLNPPAEAPEKLHLVGKQNGVEQDIPRDWTPDATWSINAAGDKVELEGTLCKMAKEGGFEALTFKYGCVDLPPAPPPEVPE